MPTSNSAVWRAKFDRNVARDTEQISALKRLGWRVLVIWECETRDEPGLILRLRRFLK
jgi:DNA mismatch endonuclease (patch repair protein)